MDTAIKESVAILFCHVIKEDEKDIEVERPVFANFMKQNFNMKTKDSNELLDNIIERDCNIDEHISILKNALFNHDYDKMSVLKQLNHIIFKSHISEEDYDFFDKVKKAFFPEI
ncbi:MAG: hypothetical protein KN64_03505 [Sulfurovum sp. AS07-7]|nr:MAG: hypothetical protein KN64_03505 [Sulfurovum sp. AS07-7]MBD3794866.1 hypothetical protein [Campylobacterota bacterium]MBD3839548.1 hypothetical protein [Campylobacterota bacterium]TQV63517.1 MAG: hypothetical protein FNT15_03565 [Sulfurovum sp.]